VKASGVPTPCVSLFSHEGKEAKAQGDEEYSEDDMTLMRGREAFHTATLAVARPALTVLLATCLGVLPPVTACAWLYPEHRDMTALAVQRLAPEARAVLEQLWSESRAGHEARLCAPLVETAPGNPACIDFAAWPAIAGDHACSARDLLRTVLDTPWILNVARISARLKKQLSTATRRDQRLNAMRTADIELQRADPHYATRAGANNVHFLLARPDVDIEPGAYARLVLGPGAELNAIGAYVWYHLRALAQAARLARGDLAPVARAQVALAALADEAFALHFLEDSFAAGHMAGTWGKAPVRKGTHDYYNEHGLEMVTWNGHHFVGQGDAYMRPQDAERAASAISDSLAQLIGALDAKGDTDAAADGATETEPEAFDVCQQSHFPALAGTVAEVRALVPIIVQTPVPALGPGPGELPRFHAELGPFVGVSAAARGVALAGGFGATQTGVSTTGGLEGAVRVGLGLEGVLNEASDSLAFVEAGFRQDASTLGAATVPGRGAITARLRIPFWLLPGDLLLAAPVLALASPHTLQQMAVQAANGGLIPWQAGIATPIGRFQFVLGREVGLSLYRSRRDDTIRIETPGVGATPTTLVTLRSLQVELPVLEYRPFRSFALDQSSSLVIQFYAGFDTPLQSSVVSPEGAPKPALRTVGLGGIRVVFDWRYYLQ
jgi:hypothetical protein